MFSQNSRISKFLQLSHLYKKIYLTVVASLISLVIVAGLSWKLMGQPSRFESTINTVQKIAIALLPPVSDPVDVQKKKLQELSIKIDLQLALFDKEGNLIARTAESIPAPKLRRWHKHREFHFRRGIWISKLPDNRWIVIKKPHIHNEAHEALRMITFLGVIACAIAIAIYPAVRGLTGRLERLQKGVEILGSGDLSARVAIEGKDEIARLAQSFNIAAERIQALMQSHKMFLANASHELRTPLSRLRVTVELLKDKANPKHKKNLETDIAELDSMIEEILLASRLNALDELDLIEDVDFLALVAEEASRYPDFLLNGQSANIRGDCRLLRRLIRNLLENAKNYGVAPVVITLENKGGLIHLNVTDQGKDIPEADFERIFEPFYRPEGATSQHGTGLGLALVRQISEKHGGSARLQYSEQHTTCFSITLPAQ